MLPFYTAVRDPCFSHFSDSEKQNGMILNFLYCPSLFQLLGVGRGLHKNWDEITFRPGIVTHTVKWLVILNFWTQLLSPVSKHHTIRICFTGLYHTFFFFQKVCQRWSQVNQQSTKRLACSVLRLVYQRTIQILSNERCKSQRYDCSYNVTDLNKRVMLKFEISKKCFSLIIVFSVTIHVYIYIF